MRATGIKGRGKRPLVVLGQEGGLGPADAVGLGAFEMAPGFRAQESRSAATNRIGGSEARSRTGRTRVPLAVVTRILLVTQMISGVGLVASEHWSDAGAEALRVTIVSEPWAAPFTVAELASAVRLRLKDAAVGVVAAAPPGGGSERSVTVRWLDTPGLRVERGSGDAVEFPLGDGGRAGADRARVARRAALFIALFAEQGAALPRGAPPDVVATPPPSLAPPAPAPVPPDRVVRARWSLSAHVGPALAFGDDGISSTEALTVRARRYLSRRTTVELGAKLSGEYEATLDSQPLGVADRAFFAGMAYEASLSPNVAMDLGVAFQYTHPVVDIDEGGPVTRLSAPTSMRLAVRTSAGVTWSPAERVTVGLSISPSFSFREREYVDDTGREVLGIGSMILDLTAGAGVRW